MGLSTSKHSAHIRSSSLEGLKERLTHVVHALESQNPSLPSTFEEQLSQAIERLESTVATLPQSVGGRTRFSRIPLRMIESRTSSSSLQPVQEILDCIPDSHIVTSAEGIIHMANQQAAKLFHVAQQELTGRSLARLITEDHWTELVKRLQTLQGDEENWQGEIQIIPNSNRLRSVICTLSALRDTDGRLVGAHWLLWDVTEHRHGIMAQEFTYEMSQLVLTGMTVEQTLNILCRRLVETFGYPLVWVGVQNAEGSVRTLAQAGDHLLSQGERVRLRDRSVDPSSTVHRAMESRITQVLHDDHANHSSDIQWLRTEGFHSEIVVPLTTDTEVLGVLTICSRHMHAFDASIVKWLEQLGSHVSKTMFVAQTYDHLRLQGKALNYAEHAVCITNQDGKIEWVNDAYCRMSGYEIGEVIGTVLPSSQSKPFRSLLKRATQQEFRGQSWKVESTETRKDGREYTVEEVLTPLLSEDGQVSNIVAILQDITSRKEAETQIIHRVYHDPLTDLPNRAMFQDRLEQALAQARRHQRLLAVFFLDLDGFKRVNDECGHRVGDQLLKTVAKRLAHCVRATDTVARLSGDEFTLLLQDLEQSTDAQHVAQKILECVGEPILLDGQILQVRTSIGIALFPVDAGEPEDLLRQADRAMYKAKEQGGQGWAFSSGDYQSCVPDPS